MQEGAGLLVSKFQTIQSVFSSWWEPFLWGSSLPGGIPSSEVTPLHPSSITTLVFGTGSFHVQGFLCQGSRQVWRSFSRHACQKTLAHKAVAWLCFSCSSSGCQQRITASNSCARLLSSQPAGSWLSLHRPHLHVHSLDSFPPAHPLIACMSREPLAGPSTNSTLLQPGTCLAASLQRCPDAGFLLLWLFLC